MTPFERALSTQGSLVAAWDLEDNEQQRLVLYSVSDRGAHQLAETNVPSETHEDVVDRLVARGARIGSMYAGTGFVWVADDDGFAVWTPASCTGGGRTSIAGVERVHVWLDPSDDGHRGVRFDLSDGRTVPVAEERDVSPEDGVALSYGTFWANYMSLHLALWANVPVENEVSPRSIQDHLLVHRRAVELARTLESNPHDITDTLGAVGRASELVIQISGGSTRHVDVLVKVGASTLAKTIKRGTSAQVAGFLRRVTSPSAMLSAMNVLINEHTPR